MKTADEMVKDAKEKAVAAVSAAAAASNAASATVDAWVKCVRMERYDVDVWRKRAFDAVDAAYREWQTAGVLIQEADPFRIEALAKREATKDR